MSSSPSYLEWEDSQLPALRLLKKLGYTYLSPEEARQARGGSLGQVLLESVLAEQLRRINRIRYKGGEYDFSDENIFAAIEALRNPPNLGLVQTNERVYDLLTLGKSLEQTIEGDRKSFSLRYIDWGDIANNAFHVTDEFQVAGLEKERTPDIALFVNGIPFAVIECKRRDRNQSVEEGIAQMRRNQQREEGIPRLFHYTQLLISAQPNEVRYGTTGTERKWWAVWKETGLDRQLEPCLSDQGADGGARLPTEQDRVLYALCRPERLMELSYRFVVFEAGEKKVARYQQYFAVRKCLERVRQRTSQGQRRGGVIWHTQGSGKSLTMVMLAKALSLSAEIDNPRVVIVRDRVNLDDQIWKTFHYCGKEPQQARTGSHLLELLEEPGNEVVTALIDKFDAAAKKRDYSNPAHDIFVLVDESHRSHYGLMHVRMKKILPNACYIGFTGTPLMKDEKSTARKFGGFIDQYTIDQAVKDEAVVPLLYEGRYAHQEIDRKQLDRGHDRVAEGLTEYQARDLRRKAATEDQVFQVEQNIEEIAYDITRHYVDNWQGTGFKAQLATPSKRIALRFHEYFEREGKIRVACLISPPDKPEGEDEPYDADREGIQRFWKRMMERYGSEEDYNKQIVASFRDRTDGIELVVVVNKLTTGFDAPRNTILYLAKKATGHDLLQVIARVNRPFPGKDFGYIIDYRGNLGDLSEALTAYSALAEFEEEELAGTLVQVMEELRKLPQRYSEVWDVFKGVENKRDIEAMERFLADEEQRHTFYEKLAAFARTLQAALASEQFHAEVPAERIDHYLAELKFFQSLRFSVRQRYAETVDFKEYEERIRKLMDTHVSTEEVTPLTKVVNIFDREAFESEVERIAHSTASKADYIAHHVKKTLTERMDEDPARYRRFSEMIQQVIDDFQQKRLSELEFLQKAREIYQELVRDGDGGMPEALATRPEARPYYHVLDEILVKSRDGESDIPAEKLAAAGIGIEGIIERLKIVDWENNPDTEKEMRNAVEDFLLELGLDFGTELSFDEIDLILDQSIQIARS